MDRKAYGLQAQVHTHQKTSECPCYKYNVFLIFGKLKICPGSLRSLIPAVCLLRIVTGRDQKLS